MHMILNKAKQMCGHLTENAQKAGPAKFLMSYGAVSGNELYKPHYYQLGV